MSAPTNEVEAARLKALARLDILDTPPETSFDDLTHLAAQICGTPMAAFTLIDADRQWFKAKIGLDFDQTSRDISFCAHTILEAEGLTIFDALEDARFAANPLVTGEPKLRFYAGMPLVTLDGHAVGALCVLDSQPRQLDEKQQDALRRLARQGAALLDARPQMQANSRAESATDNADSPKLKLESAASDAKFEANFVRATLDSLASHIAVLDKNGTIVATNRAWRQFSLENGGDGSDGGVGVNYITICDAADEENSDQTAGESMSLAAGIRDVMAGRRPSFSLQYPCHSPSEERWFNVHVSPFRGEFQSELQGQVEGEIGRASVVVSHENISAQKKVEQELQRAEAQQRRLAQQLEIERFRLVAAQRVAGVGSWETDLATRNVLWSLETHRIHGTDPATFAPTHAKFLELVHPGDRDRVAQAFEASLTQSHSCEAEMSVDCALEHRLLLPNGEVRTVEERWQTFADASGRAVRAVGTCQDISERKAAELALEATAREIVTTWESMTDAFFSLDTQWRFTHVNSECARLVQKSASEMLGVSIFEVFPAIVDSEIERNYRRAAQTQQKVSFEAFFAPLDAWFELHAYPSSVGLSVYFRNISEQKRADSLLGFQKLLLQAQTEASLDAILVVGHDRKILSLNQRLVQMWNIPPDAVERGDDAAIREAILSKVVDRPAIVARAESLYNHPTEKTREEIALLDGRILDRFSAPILDAEGAHFGRVWFFRDITQAKRAERTLRDHQQQFESIVSNVPGMVYQFVLQPDGSIEWPFVSEGSREIYEAEPEFIQANPNFPVEVIHPDDIGSFQSSVMESVETLLPWRWEGRHRVASGKTVWLQGLARPQRLASGGTLWDGVVTDITARKEAEKERDRFFNVSLDMLAVLGFDGYFKRLNPAFTETLGFSEAQFMAKPFLDWVHPDDHGVSIAAFAEVGATGVVNCENRYLSADGSYHWLEWKATAVREDGIIYAAARDVTERKAADAALLRLRDELEERVVERTAELHDANREMYAAKQEADAANAAKSEFLSRMSHELRTPLNAILGFGQLLEMSDLDAGSREGVGHILRGGRHLLDLINEVLDISRVESGHLELSLEPINLDDVVPEACALVRLLASERNITLSCGDFSTGINGHHVLADRQRIKQVLINLLANAIKYNRQGGRVEVKCQTNTSGWTSIAVHDTGMGIAPHDLPKLFVPFERLGAAKSNIEGTGLGLVLSQRLVSAMGGTLSAQSIVGVGSIFTLVFPSADSPASMLELPPADFAFENRPAAQNARTVLCIEDNLSNLRLLEMLFQARPELQLLTAMQGQIGLDLARQHLPDLILLDLNLPDLHGKDVLWQLQQAVETRDIPVVVISADATPHQIERLMASGAKAYLTKPLDVEQFLGTLGLFL